VNEVYLLHIKRITLFPIVLASTTFLCAAAELSVDPPTATLKGPRQRLQLVVHSAGPVDVTRQVAYAVEPPGIITVSETGQVTPRGDGTAVVTATIAESAVKAKIVVQDFATVPPVSFEHETLPVLARSGCSGGACHGAPNGKAGFRLSLFGSDSEFDRRALVREAQGRRVSPLNPQNSMLLMKPTMELPHLGGRRFASSDTTYVILRDWITEGCRVEKPAVKCVGINVFPAGPAVLRLPNAVHQLRVIARFSDDSERDVTHLAKFETSDASIADVARNGFVRGYARGDLAVIVRYQHHIETPLLTFVRNVEGFEWSSPVVINEIDAHVDRKLQQMQFTPGDICDDETFLRRVWLDVVGILPTIEERQRFLESTSETKRSELIEDLLERPEYARFWGQKWGDLLRVSRKQIGLDSALTYATWLQTSVQENVPYDVFARQILTATGDTTQNPAANYYRTSADTNDAMETSAQLFLGTRIQCAKCHNHPFERWTQDNYYGLAAVFHRVERKPVLKEEPENDGKKDKKKKNREVRAAVISDVAAGDVIHPSTGQAVLPWVPALGELAVAEQTGRRNAFADWLTAENNPFFAQVEVNRIWTNVMGRGIVEPFDDFRDSNPPSNASLLNFLAEEFRIHKYDRKHVLRLILNSRTYQTSSTVSRFNATDTRYFSHYRPRRLSAEQLVDAISEVVGVQNEFVGVPAGTKATWLPAPDLKPHNQSQLGSVDFLKVFGQPERQSACECERGDETSLGQALELLNGEYLNKRLTAPENRFRQLLQAGTPLSNIIRELYCAALCREPTKKELSVASEYANRATDKTMALEDICWAIVNKDEFLFQH
jgi:hypothetical protein